MGTRQQVGTKPAQHVNIYTTMSTERRYTYDGGIPNTADQLLIFTYVRVLENRKDYFF